MKKTVSMNALLVALVGFILSLYIGLRHDSVIGFLVMFVITAAATGLVNRLTSGPGRPD
ncbi:hypothetical protein [Corynebacterium bovis]|uniref:Divalent metal cation (Fe/Co/Zn/Cd) transporter n=1 Tax=Corynebacterium bovis DSM 20582 = CIP 54.80 TaxID=927655 RepID=A0A8I0CPW2_9CORY|nr:hypothetical protein [Corynebacterium bovis]MBB3116835.1 divalent metal cation (Fe/Co/Zn/Cd) transporter [Corynebacterium bovis DSM 20582 = CIP 54.80]MDH2455348.1 hypothetical protein [Corynebacterium bovis]MDK8510546.1 hypothetical protein [Corynebacterium bovis]QQC47496.1 hypothetical protein I6I09_00345 [Corynebacterium bovis]WJY77261.1 hypothetical protein CBOVI_03635 [Corynebacterium bovis DSM 20582 = CIP 54.80]